jgi:tripartite-type tricarboxylate transporter receptor subunit TctC
MPIARRAFAALLAAPAVAPSSPWAQPAWNPTQPVRVIIPFTPGGTMDPVVRIVQAILARGPRGARGDRAPARRRHRRRHAGADPRSRPDGHTLLMIANSFSRQRDAASPARPTTPLRDFAPITMATVVPHVLAIHPSVARDFPSFLEAGPPPRPGPRLRLLRHRHLRTTSGGEQFRELARLNATHVPYNGAPQANTDLLGNRLQFMFANLPDMIPAGAGGPAARRRHLAERRVRELPDVPTVAELGFPLVLSDSWFGLISRADVPAAARARLETAWIAALNRPEVKSRLEETGFTVLAKPAAAFGADIRRYADIYAGVIRANNIRVE